VGCQGTFVLECTKDLLGECTNEIGVGFSPHPGAASLRHMLFSGFLPLHWVKDHGCRGVGADIRASVEGPYRSPSDF